MSQVFLNDDSNAKFLVDGFIILNNIIDIDFEDTYKFFNNQKSNVDNKFYSSLWSSNQEYRVAVDSKIKEILSPVNAKYLNRYNPFFSDLLVKKPSLNHRLNRHQDWTFIDEDTYTPVFIWCPLMNVTKRNGCIMILPKSHLYFKSIRGSNIPTGLDYKELERLERRYAQYLEMKKGDILILNQSLLHASLPNRSFRNRLALGLYCLPENIPVYHYHYDVNNKKYLKYQINPDFILKFSSNQNFKDNLYQQKMLRPEGMIIKENTTLNRPFSKDIYVQYEDSLKTK